MEAMENEEPPVDLEDVLGFIMGLVIDGAQDGSVNFSVASEGQKIRVTVGQHSYPFDVAGAMTDKGASLQAMRASSPT